MKFRFSFFSVFLISALGFISATIIIIEDAKVCFRRILAGKRIARRYVRRSLFCERLEDCQQECGDEKRFLCEGFNYRLDPTGRGKGECELIDVPLHTLDTARDVYPDREYDYYERDRNAAAPNCQPRQPYPGYDRPRPYDPPQPDYHRRPSYGPDYDRRPPMHERRPYYERPEYDRRPQIDYDRRRPPAYDRRPTDYDRRRPSHGIDYDRPGAISYHHSHNSQHGYDTNRHIDRNDNIYQGTHYLPPNPSHKFIYSQSHNYKYIPYGYGTTYDRPKSHGYVPQDNDRNRFDFEKKNYYLPPRVGGTNDWGKYGGSYGNFGHGYNQPVSQFEHNYKYWGFGSNRRNDKPSHPPPKPGSYLPTSTALEINRIHQGPNIYNIGDNLILPAEPRFKGPNYLKEECSLRSAAGFKFSKGIVRRYYVVPNIYECEILCFKERSFPCASYAFRYTVSLSAPADNCYLSEKTYKELDYYTDLQPDRDFDIYTMNNLNKCVYPVVTSREDSECFWRVRSGQKLDRRVVKDSIQVKSIVDCQLECLKSRRFTCRVFSFRYGVSRGPDNCQLSDWPYYELDSRIDFVPERGYEVYERGSFGYGCEPNHFGIRGRPQKPPVKEITELCYIGFGKPARLLPQATKKAILVKSELDCKLECSKLRELSLFQCMSFSYRPGAYDSSNCFLSDIYQRDLLPHIDYVLDSNSWIFAWDHYNPQCIELTIKHINDVPPYPTGRDRPSTTTALDTWRAYSVSGWPCKRGHLCEENREAGFWFCKLEGGDSNTWDYCCRPDHQCGYSSGYSYPWCYVGPERTQWRKCSDHYYPYIHDIIDRLDTGYGHNTRPINTWVPNDHGIGTHYLPEPDNRPSFSLRPPVSRPSFRPDRPPASPHERPPQPSLDEYEMQFDQQFLAPPKPGGFAQPRHWPVSYLHKDMPPNITDFESRLMKAERKMNENSKVTAIQSLIDIINSNNIQNVQYQILNESNSMDDILFVKIPLPTNFTEENKQNKNEKMLKKEDLKLETVDVPVVAQNTTRVSKSLDIFTSPVIEKRSFNTLKPTYRKSYITRTNVSSHGRAEKFVTSNF